MKFKITFDHTVVETYSCTVEAESKDEALEIFHDSPFDCDDCPEEPENIQGLSIDVTNVEVIETVKLI
jgi:hypothetical protein